ncbi:MULTISPECIES: homocysteine S-methyltransferase family protein [Alteromonas]|uniref:Homocysteine S-methyltransferase family protein n=2 Tax=Alteromonas stellipolaris TaxID=233316 RepID=A0AAW7YZV5_9ALTE|nr:MULTISPECIES: homocysteine S-methyltransferase family protein [Alteromonas]AMJ92207.1 homocysteine methyltransferase [Alteromonas sp. Mac2]AMJ75925.1 homocysteine methyltransferase [Alteromonas stellipolaris]AMJ88352.1 homocysteine methyltransferase [Alteromonas sp. Mac1]ANB20930.1 homocysteine methyltransferase [Alteromonas stellipolaris]ANB25193.1 homocysteine methyltransferase [Alteromonas stellipolaris]
MVTTLRTAKITDTSSTNPSSNVLILDGGLGRELERVGAPFRQPEWSALSLMKAPDLVAQVHQNFVDAGAKIITTNTYALVPFHIGQKQFDEQAFLLAERAAGIARTVAEKCDVLVAGCIPPAFGSYKPELFCAEQLSSILLPLIEAQASYIDFWLVETVSSVEEAIAVTSLLKQHSSKPIWLSYSLSNRHDFATPVTLRSSEPLNAILPTLDNLDAVLFNCSQPEEMEAAIAFTHSHNAHIPIGVYANSFSEHVRKHDANEMLSTLREDVTPEKYLTYAQTWVNAGASIVGGCCGIGPAHIQALAQGLVNALE